MQPRSESEALWWRRWTVLCGYAKVNSSVFSLALKVPEVLAVCVYRCRVLELANLVWLDSAKVNVWCTSLQVAWPSTSSRKGRNFLESNNWIAHFSDPVSFIKLKGILVSCESCFKDPPFGLCTLEGQLYLWWAWKICWLNKNTCGCSNHSDNIQNNNKSTPLLYHCYIQFTCNLVLNFCI